MIRQCNSPARMQEIIEQCPLQDLPKLVMTNSSPWDFAMALIEIDGLPTLKMVVIFHGKL